MAVKGGCVRLLLTKVLILTCLSQAPAKNLEPIFKSIIDPLDSFDEFDWNITRIIGYKVPGNLLLSPISLKLVLAMLYEGAAGHTATELQKALGIENVPSNDTKYSNILKSLAVSNEGYVLDIGMKLFIDNKASPKKEYAQKISDKYNATIEKVDFSNTAKAVEQINNWAKSVTKGHIEHLVSEADTKATTVLLLLNAVYFKGLWLNPFPLKSTVEGRFYTGGKSHVCVDYMVAELSLDYVDSQELKAELVRMPYMGGKFAFYVILPNEDTTIETVLGSLSPAKTRSLINKMSQEAIIIALPKFKYEFASSLAPFLQELGIKDIFSGQADLRNIAEGSRDLVVSNVIQKAVIDVNERGTVAAAASGLELVNKFGMHSPLPFNVSRPFAFFIEDETTRTVIFVGKVVNPTDPGRGKVSSSTGPKPKEPAASAAPPSAFIEANSLKNRVSLPTPTQFHHHLDIDLTQLISFSAKGNWVASPTSIKSALGLLLEGSSKNTATEICQVLNLPNDIDRAKKTMYSFQEKLLSPQHTPGVEVIVANKIFAQKSIPVKADYNERALLHYKADTKEMDFSNPTRVSKVINTWVSEQTKNYIKNIVEPDDVKESSVLFIVNVIYFKGRWKYGFNPLLTRDANFYSSNSIKVIKMMSTTGTFKIGRSERLNSQILEIPYENPRYSMVVILPNDGIHLSRVVSDLSRVQLMSIINDLQKHEADVVLPKFTITYNIDLIPVLKTAGLKDLFSDNADLSGIVQTNAKVTSFIHQAKIEVSENGTIAGAATFVNVQLLIASDKRRFIANRPFLFFIRDDKSGFLFSGQFIEPSNDQVVPVQRPSESIPSKTIWTNHAL